MYHPYLFQIVMRERERQILEEMGRGGYHRCKRRGRYGLSKKIAGRLRSLILRIKEITSSRQNRQQTTDGKGGLESWKKEFS